MYTRVELADSFRRLGVSPGDTVMLHASVRAVGAVAGGPDQIHLSLKDALTPDGTLIMYASCPPYYDDVGRGHLDAALEREILEKLPPFDPGPRGPPGRTERSSSCSARIPDRWSILTSPVSWCGEPVRGP